MPSARKMPDGKTKLLDPVGIAESICDMRAKVAGEWADGLVERVEEGHLALRREVLEGCAAGE